MGFVRKYKKGEKEFQEIALNTREDLFRDFQFYISMAMETPVRDPETLCAQQRFLRPALLILFAYVEAVVNSWVYFVLESHNLVSVFKCIERSPLDQKIEFLYDSFSAIPGKLNIEEAKRLRNLFVHFKPGRDGEAFDALKVDVVVNAARSVDNWMKEMETITGRQRHPFTKDLAAHLADQESRLDEGNE